MKKMYVYAYFLAAGLAAILNFLFITDVLGFVAVQIGGCAVAVPILMGSTSYHKEKDSPVYYKNWKKNPITAILFCAVSFAFITTLAIAVFSIR